MSMKQDTGSVARREANGGPARTRRSVLPLLAMMALSPYALAQGKYPGKPIRVVVPYGAGSSLDVTARLWGARLAQLAGQPVIIDNKPGAASIVGTQAVIAAPMDGHTLLYTVANTLSINPFIYRNLPYAPDELSPVSRILTVPLVMVVPASSPIQSVQQLVAAARAHPAAMNYASYGTGTSMHVAMARFLTAAGITMTHVPYKDAPLMGVIAGLVDVSFEPSTTAMGHIKAGKIRALGVSSPQPVAALPGVPTIAETYPGFVGDSWHGVFVRSGTSPDILNSLNEMSQKIVDNDEFRKQLTDLGLVPAGGSRAAFKAFLADDASAWSKVVKDYAIRAD